MDLLIGGIDPGTQNAYALLTLEGELVALSSERNRTKEETLQEMNQHGKIFLIGTDVTPAPSNVKKIASKLGAVLIEPDRNLQFHEKIRIVDEYLKKQDKYITIENKHEKDALCAALLSLKKINYLLKKIKDTLKKEKKEHLYEEVKRKVFLENMPIMTALKSLS